MRYIKNYSKFNEALNPSQFRKYVNAFDKERYADIFKQIGDDYEHDRNYYRVYIPLEKVKQTGYISNTHKMVDQFLNDNGLEIVDYVDGTAKYKSDDKSIRKNDEITNQEVKLVGANVKQGLYTIEDALNIAREMNLDLVETSDKGNQSICQVIDYNKYIQDKSKEVRTVKVGQILQRLKNDKLGLAFTSDEKRKALTSTEGEDLMVVISRHPYDIAGSDTDRDWTNCMTIGTSKSNRLTKLMDELEKVGSESEKLELKAKIDGYKRNGENVKYLIHEVKEGSLISYLIKSSDRNIERPLGVLNIKPHINRSKKSESILASSSKMYGLGRPEFKLTVDDILDKYFNKDIKGHTFKINKKVYDDDDGQDLVFFDRMKTEDILKYFKISKFKINEDGTVDVNANLMLVDLKLKKLPIKFGKVSGNFYCSNNQLSSLEGCPKEVGISFICSNNQLTSLEGSPEKVGLDFHCSNNQLISLEGCPKKVNGNFDCSNNNLTTLEGGPSSVGGSFNCSNNQLTSLEGCPEELQGKNTIKISPKGAWVVFASFDCSNNQLSTLEGCPKKSMEISTVLIIT